MINPATGKDEVCALCGRDGHFASKCKLGRAADAGQKDDAGKAPWGLLPWDALGSVVEVLRRGAIKYEAENWRKVPDWRQCYWDATLRHLTAWKLGERNDPEWGLPHLAHAACCVLFMLAFDVKEEK